MNRHPVQKYVLAFLGVSLGVTIQVFLNRQTGLNLMGILYPCMFMIAWYLGFGPSLFAIFISLLATDYFIFVPKYSFKIFKYSELVRMSVFVLTSIFASWIVVKGRKSDAKAASTLTALAGLQSRFSRSAKAINLGVWYCDLPFNELIWDKETKEHFWLPEDARVTIDTFYEHIHPDDRERTRKAIEQSIATHGPYDIVYRTTPPNDSTKIKFIRAIGWTDYDLAGNPTRFDGITFDVTNVRKVATDLEESLEVVETINRVGRNLSAELNQKKLVQEVTDAATQLSKAEFGAFFYNLINEQGESYTLYTVSGVPIENFSKFPMPRNTEVFAPTFAGEGIIRSGDITKDPRYGKNEPYLGMPKGHLPVRSYLAVPVISRTGEVIGALFLGHKKTEVFSEREERIVAGLASQIAIAMDNARLFDKSREAIRLRDEFLSISSHELKTPLTSLKLQLQYFSRSLERGQREVMEESKVKNLVTICNRQVNRLNSLVEDMLDVSRIVNGKLNLNYEDVDLAELVTEVIERYRPMATEAKCSVEVHTTEKFNSRIDRLRIEQVLINLFTNAIKYASGCPIKISLAEAGGEVELVIKDSGPGISPENQKRIFDRFERTTYHKGQGGLGLGLYIAQQIVAAHGGAIHLQSDIGKGSEFIVRFPVKPLSHLSGHKMEAF